MIDQLLGMDVLVYAQSGPAMCGQLSQVNGSTVMLLDAYHYATDHPHGRRNIFPRAVLRGVVSVLAYKART